MTQHQRKLIEKTLTVIGYLAIVTAAGLVLYGIGWTVANDKNMGKLVGEILDIEAAGIIFYPAVAISILAFWIRAYLKAGGTNNSSASPNT